MIAHLQKTVIECPDPRQLAEFYCSVLGMRVIGQDSDDWVVIGSAPNVRELAFQRVDPRVAPLWRDQVQGPRLHLDLWVTDIDRAEQNVLTLGARRAPGSPETGYRVFLDPVGHPFCLIFGPASRRDPRFMHP